MRSTTSMAVTRCSVTGVPSGGFSASRLPQAANRKRESDDDPGAQPHDATFSRARPLPAAAGRTSPRNMAASDERTTFFDHA